MRGGADRETERDRQKEREKARVFWHPLNWTMSTIMPLNFIICHGKALGGTNSALSSEHSEGVRKWLETLGTSGQSEVPTPIPPPGASKYTPTDTVTPWSQGSGRKGACESAKHILLC